MGPLVPYERIADDKWLNASFGEVKAKNIIERRVGALLHCPWHAVRIRQPIETTIGILARKQAVVGIRLH